MIEKVDFQRYEDNLHNRLDVNKPTRMEIAIDLVRGRSVVTF